MTETYLPSPNSFVADHVTRYEATAGASGGTMDNGARVVILTTTGRRTGMLRKSPIIRVPYLAGYLAIASMGGADRHPAWYLNIVEHAEVTVQDFGSTRELRGRTATGEERRVLWPVASEVWPDYEAYQLETDRQIPVVVLEPR
ncbi:MAG: nitroreductase family deazaflavin-dependent oxidoreductase [Acidimicrobiia bacterium]|nr:nitroreductase family deazaflavin-dependent oxidoreductase [Acidimicrobiia bacterium]